MQEPKLVTSMKPLLKALKTGHTVIVGQTQYGKTTAALSLFLEPVFSAAAGHGTMRSSENLLCCDDISGVLDLARSRLPGIAHSTIMIDFWRG